MKAWRRPTILSYTHQPQRCGEAPRHERWHLGAMEWRWSSLAHVSLHPGVKGGTRQPLGTNRTNVCFPLAGRTKTRHSTWGRPLKQTELISGSVASWGGPCPLGMPPGSGLACPRAPLCESTHWPEVLGKSESRFIHGSYSILTAKKSFCIFTLREGNQLGGGLGPLWARSSLVHLVEGGLKDTCIIAHSCCCCC